MTTSDTTASENQIVADGLADVVSQELPNISRQVDQRRRVIELLSDAGMSQRAIAQAVGVSKGTVQNDQVDRNCPPAAPAATRPDDTLTDEEADQLAEELKTIAADIAPHLLGLLEECGGDFTARVALAETAKVAWDTRMSEIHGTDTEGADQ